MEEIRTGFEHGLTVEQVSVYAKPELTAPSYNYGCDNRNNQMREIRLGLEHGISVEQAKVYANPEFKWPQMREVREGFESGLALEQIGYYGRRKKSFVISLPGGK